LKYAAPRRNVIGMMTRVKPTGFGAFTFMRHFVRNPMRTGALFPSSRFLVDRMLGRVEWSRARVIVELGPGLGCCTREILRRMRSDAVLVAIEMNPRFAHILRETLPDPRLVVVNASAAQVDSELRARGYRDADCIISCLPFANMPAAQRRAIVRRSHQMLRPHGRFVLFQYRSLLLPMLNRTFDAVHREFEPINIPPAHVFVCVK
jgi:phospholipid N-methyltransferase